MATVSLSTGARDIMDSTPRIGDPGWVLDTSSLAPRFSDDMQEWALAGVEGGIPPRDALHVRATISPGDDIQAAIDSAAARGGGVVVLAAGEYRIEQTISLRDSVVLRGSGAESTVLRSVMTAEWLGFGEPMKTTILMDQVSRAGLEDLTVYYRPDHIDYPPQDKEFFNAYNCPDCGDRIFYNDTQGDADLYVQSVAMYSSQNCWIDKCRIVESGSTTINLWHSSHITCRDNVVDRAHNKFGGQGYYALTGSDHCLLYNEHIRRIRHLSLQVGARHNVVYDCMIEVDVNFHNADSGSNLIENNRIAIPYWHWWKPFQRGAPNQHNPPGPGNILFHNRVNHMNFRKGDKALDWGSAPIPDSVLKALRAAQANTQREATLPEGVLEQVFTINSTFESPTVLPLTEAPPLGGTFYAVKHAADAAVAVEQSRHTAPNHRPPAIRVDPTGTALVLDTPWAGGGTCELLTVNGRRIVTASVSHTEPDGALRVQLESPLAPGHYVVRAATGGRIVAGRVMVDR